MHTHLVIKTATNAIHVCVCVCVCVSLLLLSVPFVGSAAASFPLVRSAGDIDPVTPLCIGEITLHMEPIFDCSTLTPYTFATCSAEPVSSSSSPHTHTRTHTLTHTQMHTHARTHTQMQAHSVPLSNHMLMCFSPDDLLVEQWCIRVAKHKLGCHTRSQGFQLDCSRNLPVTPPFHNLPPPTHTHTLTCPIHAPITHFSPAVGDFGKL